MKKLEKDECGCYFYNLEEAKYYMRCAFSDILGYFTYKGLKGIELMKAASSLTKTECESVIDGLLNEPCSKKTK